MTRHAQTATTLALILVAAALVKCAGGIDHPRTERMLPPALPAGVNHPATPKH